MQLLGFFTKVNDVCLASRIVMPCCFDIASRSGYYLMGNTVAQSIRLENLIFAKLLSTISETFNFDACSFSNSKMNKRGKSSSNATAPSTVSTSISGDPTTTTPIDSLHPKEISKELRLWGTKKEKKESIKLGTSRVAIYKHFRVYHSYTIECSANPFTGVDAFVKESSTLAVDDETD